MTLTKINTANVISGLKCAVTTVLALLAAGGPAYIESHPRETLTALVVAFLVKTIWKTLDVKVLLNGSGLTLHIAEPTDEHSG